MTRISRRELRQLADTEGEQLVSLYMPLYSGAESRQNAVRFKNLLRNSEDALLRKGVRARDAKDLLAEAEKLVDQPPVWEAAAHGLAAFIDGDLRVWHLPFRCDERCVTGKYFYVIPLLNWLAENASYYVLAISQNSVQFFHGNRFDMEPLDIPGLPTDLKTALHYDQREGIFQAHSAGPQLPGKESLVFHGQGGEVDVSKDELLSFFREIDRALAAELELETDPLVFVGVDYLFPIYRDVNSYAHMLPTHVAGNPELMTPVDIRQHTWPLIESAVDERRQAELAKYGDHLAHGRSLNRIENIIIAAQAGAVETLFIDPAAKCTGEFDSQRLALQVDDQPQDDHEDLVNLISTLVIRGSGAVEPLADGNIPGGGAMAAVMRYVYPPAMEAMETARQS
jgi:hypothetical protein